MEFVIIEHQEHEPTSEGGPLVRPGRGSLNAFATRFLGRNMVVLYSDLLEACRDNDDARDMIVGTSGTADDIAYESSGG